VTLNAKTHGVIHDTLGHRHLSDIAMTDGTLNLGAYVRSMVETNVRLFVPSVDALPWDVFAPLVILRNFLDDRPVCGDELVAAHADPHTWNRCARTPRDGLMAVIALQLQFFDMRFVSVLNGLHRFVPESKEVPDRFSERGVRRCK